MKRDGPLDSFAAAGHDWILLQSRPRICKLSDFNIVCLTKAIVSDETRDSVQ